MPSGGGWFFGGALRAFLNVDQVAVGLGQLLLDLRTGQGDLQDTVLKLGVDVLLLDLLAHIEAAGAGAREGLAADVAAILAFVAGGVAADGLDGQITVLQLHLDVLLFAAGQVHIHLIAVLDFLHVGFHHVGCPLAEGVAGIAVQLPLHIAEERIKPVIEQILMKNSRQ